MSRDTGRAAAGRAGSFNSGKNKANLVLQGFLPWAAAHRAVARHAFRVNFAFWLASFKNAPNGK
jgi:hypothetical protein